ncbi:hypothetical protein M885DRAFT_512583 [Pelagophyceae sp. CCMP2097]|nr:hypothetical protein M885DRAFT_512583 [Pelagophyceae sp. CCMP2097]|mmetsp:Transcript_7861/g.25670  ORF Transcript_7861/g.25670 Transcript_7861/m.25670 type:complete len:202 (+) Transcript_7861:123-728(+)
MLFPTAVLTAQLLAASLSLQAPAVPAAPEASRIVLAASMLDALEPGDVGCVGKALRTLPFTDAQLPAVGGNVPKSQQMFARGAYERPLPTVGNALRKAIDAYERSRPYALSEAVGDAVFFDRERQNVALDLDYLDLLRNSWLDAVQALESDASDDDPPPNAAELKPRVAAARAAGAEYLKAARLSPAPPADRLCAEDARVN